MSARSSAVLATSVLVLAALVVPAVAHPSGGSALMDRQAPSFAEAVASNAAEHSNAPSSMAPCIDGMAADTFPCDGIDMLSWVDQESLGLTFVNDMWGWTDPATGQDWALVGGAEGTAFVDISDPKRPEVAGILPTHSAEGGEFWRDVKVYADHAYIVSEHEEHGLQVFDLTQLRTAPPGYTTFGETAHYEEFEHAHNIAINTDTGFAYVVGSETCDGGLHMIDLAQPANPSFAGCFTQHGYIHDTQCVIYTGPDATYRGREICFSAAAQFSDFSPAGILNTLSIADVTDKAAPQGIANVEYSTDGYSHQGWLVPGQAYFLHGDELDEIFHGIPTRTRVWDVRDLDEPAVIGAYDNEAGSIDHNIYTEGRYAYASNYTSGLRVYDTRQVADGNLTEVAYFDVYPENDNASFEGGTWSNYAWFRQKGIVAVSSIDRGLFVLQPRLSRAGG